ncbi:MAG: hypothetical protein GXX85_14245 [Ignavibacteria bacterium]|jgi:cell division protein FtsL|nr:hypothetical protein [Ignavibacteria bacterium]
MTTFEIILITAMVLLAIAIILLYYKIPYLKGKVETINEISVNILNSQGKAFDNLTKIIENITYKQKYNNYNKNNNFKHYDNNYNNNYKKDYEAEQNQ